MHKFHLLKFGRGIMLTSVGLRMVWLSSLFKNGKFPFVWSLSIIGGVLCDLGNRIAAIPQKYRAGR